MGQSGIDFVSACLQMDPIQRPTSGELLNHEYIYSARMSQFIQKDHTPKHRLATLGERTVTLPALSPTMSRTNSQSLLLLAQNQQQQHRPAKRFVVASSESPSRKTSSFIPMAIPKQQQSQLAKSQLNKHRAANGNSAAIEQVASAAEAPALAGAGSKQVRGRQPAKAGNIINNNLPAATPNVSSGNFKQQQQPANVNSTKLPDSRSLVPVAKIRNRETSMQRMAPASPADANPLAARREGRPASTTNIAAVGASDEKKPQSRRDLATRVLQSQLQYGATPNQRQIRHSNGDNLQPESKLRREEQAQGREGGGADRGKENSQSLLKANHKRKTTATESSASSSNYSDSFVAARSSSIAFLPPVYQDRHS